MATQKTLAPTNQTITIAAFQGEKPDQRQIADAEGKLADAVNALNSNTPIVFCPTGNATTNEYGAVTIQTGIAIGSGKRVTAVSNFAASLSTQYNAYAETWQSNGDITVRIRNIADGSAVTGTSIALGNIMLFIK